MSTPPPPAPQEPVPFDGTPGPPGQAALPGQLGYPGQPGVGPAPEPVPAAYGYGYGYPPRPVETSSVAIVAICLFWVPVAGLVLSIIGMVKTAGGRARGRGIAITALVLSIIVTAGAVLIGVAIGSKPSALDPGCTQGKLAVNEQDQKIDADHAKGDEAAVGADVQGLLDRVTRAQAASKRDDVRRMLQAVHDDYAAYLAGQPVDPTRLQSDIDQMNHLCTIGK